MRSCANRLLHRHPGRTSGSTGEACHEEVPATGGAAYWCPPKTLTTTDPATCSLSRRPEGGRPCRLVNTWPAVGRESGIGRHLINMIPRPPVDAPLDMKLTLDIPRGYGTSIIMRRRRGAAVPTHAHNPPDAQRRHFHTLSRVD